MDKNMKLISVVTPCYNEEGNVEEIYKRIKTVFCEIGKYEYEHIFIDNASKDNTVSILYKIAKQDKNIKIIVNSRNFGALRSHYHGLLQAKGDAVIAIVADLQDPPEMVHALIKKWEEGNKIVVGVMKGRHESKFMIFIRNSYYNILNKLSDTELIKNYTGFGLYDKSIIKILRQIEDPYPYLRGIIAEIGFEKAIIEYIQPCREKGKTSTNFYYLYDLAIIALTSYTKVPLRIATMLGFGTSVLSILVALFYFIYKLIYWGSFSLGIAPVAIGLFFFSSVQLFFLGILGEYLGSVYSQVHKRPLVVEKERINFD